MLASQTKKKKKKKKLTRVSLSREDFAELMPPPYLHVKFKN